MDVEVEVEVSGSEIPHGDVKAEEGKLEIETKKENGEAHEEIETKKENGEAHEEDETEKENGGVQGEDGVAEPIKLISDGVEESAKVEADSVKNANLPKDVVDEWPAEPQIHSFYLVRYRTYDDPNLKAKIDIEDKEIGKRNQQRFQVLEGLKAKRLDRTQVIGQLKSLGAEKRQYGQALDEKISQMKPLKEALGSLRGSKSSGREGMGLCSSENELNELIRSLNYRMQHEVIPLTEEKQIMRDMKQLEGTREKVIANAAMRAKIQDSLGPKDDIQDQVKLIGTDLDGMKKDRLAVQSKIKLLEDELKAIDSDITSLQQELASITEKRDVAYQTIQQLRKQRDEGNTCFYKNRTLLNNAKELAAKKNIKALEELASAEVDQFMSSWSNSKAFRDDYEKRILTALDMRQLSRDGRMRNPNEKPLVIVEQTKPAEPEIYVKPAPKVVNKDVDPPKDQGSVPAEKDLKETKKKQAERSTVSEPVEEEEYFTVEKPKQEKVIDAAELKEIKRQEEMEKHKQALERKKKLVEKAAAKANLKAQKEAEKKQKGREKKLKKKESSAFSSSQDDATENEADSFEAEKSDKIDEDTETQTSIKTRESKEKTPVKTRYRGQPKRRDNALPKAILKRKKSNKYWMWAGLASASVAVLLALLFRYVI